MTEVCMSLSICSMTEHSRMGGRGRSVDFFFHIQMAVTYSYVHKLHNKFGSFNLSVIFPQQYMLHMCQTLQWIYINFQNLSLQP